jgi:hypothetical protein
MIGLSSNSLAGRVGARNETIPSESPPVRDVSVRDAFWPDHGIRCASPLVRSGPDNAHPEAAHSPSPSNSSGPQNRFIKKSNTK